MKMIKAYWVLIIALTLFLTSESYAAKILAVFVFPGKSHSMVFKPIVRELAIRGNEVVMVSNFRLDEKIPNLTEVIIEPAHDYSIDIKEYFNIDDMFTLAELSVRNSFDMLNLIGYTTAEHALKNDRIQKIIHDTSQQYDLILVEQFYQDAFLILGHQFKAPIISVSTFGFENYMTNMMGVISPWSHVPQGFSTYSDRMSFMERLWNTYSCLYSEYNRRFKYFPEQDKLVSKYFSHLPGPLPSVAELEKNVSVVLLNNYIPLDISRPYVMGMIPVGGIHIQPPKTLPRDIRGFLDDARSGAIYFSLGTNLKSSDMSPQKLEAFLKVFSKLKERILWKWEDENIANLPKNVMIKKWLPQNDVLAHPHVKLFITHGGLLSTQEGVHRSVPMLGIPIYCDQHANIRKASQAGYALTLHFANITESSLTWALQELLYQPSYVIQMRKTSQIFRERPVGALETAMYWIDYVIRFKGAPHLKSAAVDLPWYKLYLLDIIAFLSLVLLLIVGCICFIVWFVNFATRKSRRDKLYDKLN